jgi:hypothetical protein
MGGTAWALGRSPSHFTTIIAWQDRPLLAYAWIIGWWTKHNRRNWSIDPMNFSVCSDMNSVDSEEVKRIIGINKKRKEHNMATRSQDELTALRSEFNSTYTGPADQADAAFADHLANLDAGVEVENAATTTPAKAKGKKAAKPAKAAKGKKAATPAPKKPAASRAKAFRPTSADRKTFNAAAAKVAGKDVKAPRLVPQAKGMTYTDFLQGKVLKLDENGSGSTALNVVSAADTKTVLGTVTVTVTKGNVKATGAKK